MISLPAGQIRAMTVECCSRDDCNDSRDVLYKRNSDSDEAESIYESTKHICTQINETMINWEGWVGVILYIIQ